jgi:hypothetical protein
LANEGSSERRLVTQVTCKPGEIVLPDEVMALIPEVKAFQEADIYKTARYTEWFRRCTSIKSLVDWNNRAFNDGIINNLQFCACVARAYSGLFQLSEQDIPYCLPSTVIKSASLAKKMIGELQNTNLLPDKAKSPVFREGLVSLSQWRPSDIPAGASRHGNPTVRWLINQIAVEFCYSFMREPTPNIVSDLVRFGWSEISDRSIRNTFTSELSLQALETAQIRLEKDNKAKVITHLVLATLPSRSKGITANKPIKELPAPIGENDNYIRFVTDFLNKPDSAERRRFISLIEAMQYDEQNYLADNGN